jgi:hypothetical protein
VVSAPSREEVARKADRVPLSVLLDGRPKLRSGGLAQGKWISYLRVSTGHQGRSGLGLEAQRKSVDNFLNGGRWQSVKEFVEVESGKKTDRHRPVLAEAIQACRLYGAKLVIAKLDRLSRNAHFLLGLKETGVDFVAADMPTANRLRGIPTARGTGTWSATQVMRVMARR